MTRKQAIAYIRDAGSRNDPDTALRVYLENRISYGAYQNAWREGQAIYQQQQRGNQYDSKKK